MTRLLLVFSVVLLMGFECSSEDACTPGETQTCSCYTGAQGSQTCSSSGQRWSSCMCSSVHNPPPDAGPPVRSCLPRGAVVLSCGCNGPAYEGQVRTATLCCSNQAISTAVGCYGYCSGGGYPWGNLCL